MTDVTLSALQDALRGLAMRQKAIADNIANVQTPGYRAQRVTFEDSLRQVLDGQSTSTSYARATSTSPARADGNNVNLDDETVDATETDLRYQATVEAINSKYRLLRTAIRGGQ